MSARRQATARLYAALCAAAAKGSPCPSNCELQRAAGLASQSAVTAALGRLRTHGRITVEWSSTGAGARRVAITATGECTGWSFRGPRWSTGVPRYREFMARVLSDRGLRFQDMGQAEARTIRRRSPPDPGMPSRPQTITFTGCALAELPGIAELAQRS